MYLHLGNDTIVSSDEIIGIFDLEKSSISPYTKEYLANMTKQKKVVNVTYEMPKSYVVTEDRLYITQLSSATLLKRATQV